MWNHKQTSQLTSAMAEWLGLMWYHIESKSQFCYVYFYIKKTLLYCNSVSLKTSSARVEEISRKNKFSMKLIDIYYQFMFKDSILYMSLTLSWRGSLSYRNQSIDLLCKSMGWFLYDRDLSHERIIKEYWYLELQRWFGTLSNMYDWTFLWKYVTIKAANYFSSQSSIIAANAPFHYIVPCTL